MPQAASPQIPGPEGKDVSIIIPVLNEEDNVQPLYQAIVDALAWTPSSFEVLFVDDGSRDATFERLRRIAERDPRVRIVKLSRNFGQTPATAAGFQHACGRVLVTLDGDLQNDPADIPAFIHKIDEGYDVVVGWRQRRKDSLISRKIPSAAANWLIAQVTGMPIKDTGCSLKAYRSSIIKSLPLYSDMHRFIPALTSVTGARLLQLPVNHFPRRYGRSKYGLSRTVKVASDVLVVKTILLTARGSLSVFHGPAAVAGVISLGAFLNGAIPYSGEHTVVSLAISILFGELCLFLVFLGVLAQLVYVSGDVRVETFSRLTERMLDDGS